MSEIAMTIQAGLDQENAGGHGDTVTSLVPDCDLSGVTCYFAPLVGLMLNGWGGSPPMFGTPHCCVSAVSDRGKSAAGGSCIEEESDYQNDGELWLAERR